MRDQIVNAFDDDRPAPSDVCVRFTFHRLPAIGPEPRLIGRYWHDRAQPDAPGIVLDQLEPRVSLDEMESNAKLHAAGERS